MRAALTAVSAAALLAAAAGPAAARPADMPLRGSHAASADASFSQIDRANHTPARDPAVQRRLATEREAAASADGPAPVPIVRVTRAPIAGGGFDWADAGIGAGLAAALLLTAAGVSTLRRQHAPATH